MEDSSELLRSLAYRLLLLSIPVVSFKVYLRLHAIRRILAKANAHRTQVSVSISNTAGFPPVPKDLAAKISQASLSELISMRESKEATCEQIVVTHIHNLRNYGAGFKVVLAERFHAALAEARKCDLILVEGKPHGLLLGLPFSVKDGISVADFPVTFGCANLLHNIQSEDANIVRALKDCGAILIAKGSMGMLGVSSESENRIVGRTENPWDVTRTSGGSSGGDAVMVCTRSVAFAMGTDIGGSLRYPAAYCGIYTLKPSSTRLSGLAPIMKSGYPPLFTAWGFLTRTVDDLALLYSLAFSPSVFDRDPCAPPLLWRQHIYESKSRLKIGYVTDDSYWPVADACKRAVLESADALKRLGHELVEFKLFDLDRIAELSWTTTAGSNEGVKKLGVELPLWSLRHAAWRRVMPGFVQAFFCWMNLKRKTTLIWKAFYEQSEQHFLDRIAEVETLKLRYNRALQEQGIDVLLVPYATPAYQHGLSSLNVYSVCWTILFNFLDLPTGSVPVTVVREEEQNHPRGNDEFLNSTSDVMKGAAGLPVSIQVVSRRYQDELCLNVMKQLETALPFKHSPPGLEALY